MRYLVIVMNLLWIFGCGTAKPAKTPENKPNVVVPPKPPVVDDDQPTPVIDSKSEMITSYLEKPVVDKKVEELALLGFSRYQDPATKLKERRDNARKTYANRAGRLPSTWIKDTFTQDEPELIDELKNLDAPTTFSIADIEKIYQEQVTKHPADTTKVKANFTLVTGVNVNYLHESALGKDAIVQLASQFNFLESPGVHKTSVLSYWSDQTQGPMGCLEAAAAALHRTATESAGKLPHALTNVLPADHDKYYKNGYLELFRVPAGDFSTVRDHIVANIKKMTILPQWVINESTGTYQIQVLSAAPSYQGGPSPTATSDEGKLVALLVAEQYGAIAKLAVIRSIVANKPVPVHFFRVGQGVFSNPREVMADAFKSISSSVKGFPLVHVYIHGYDDLSTTENLSRIDQNEVDVENMDRTGFFSAKGF